MSPQFCGKTLQASVRFVDRWEPKKASAREFEQEEWFHGHSLGPERRTTKRAIITAGLKPQLHRL